MSISMVRIDDRLVHGQVVEGWLPALGIRRLIVISDSASRDAMQRALMRLALPEDISLTVVGTSEGLEAVRRAGRDSEAALILAPGPNEVLAVLEGLSGIKRINVGGMHYEAGRVQLGKAIFLGDADMEALRTIAAKGIRLEGRGVPSDEPTDVLRLIEERRQ